MSIHTNLPPASPQPLLSLSPTSNPLLSALLLGQPPRGQSQGLGLHTLVAFCCFSETSPEHCWTYIYWEGTIFL